MVFNYKQLVLSLLNVKAYPSLQDSVVLDIVFKMIPENTPSPTVKTYDRRYDNPEDVWIRDASPFHLSYMVDSEKGQKFYLHTIDEEQLSAQFYPLQCQKILFSRHLMDGLLHKIHVSLEHELYSFLTCLNFNVPSVASILNLDFIQSTRYLPQFLNTWVDKFKMTTFQSSTVGLDVKSRFGPPADERSFLPVRLVSGQLAPCTSRKTLLSLNDDFGKLPFEHSGEPYLYHYVDRFDSLVPLAYNPLENPIVVL